MKYIVSGGATLSLADGSKFEITAGIHDSTEFPDNVKKHWAFKSYAKPLDESDAKKEQSADDLAASLVLLAQENNTLKAQLVERDKTITDLGEEITTLKAQLSAPAPAPVPATDKAADGGSSTDSQKDAANAKKQQTAK